MPVYIYNAFAESNAANPPADEPENPELYILKPMFKASFPYFKTISSRFLAGFKQLNAEVRVPEMVWVVVACEHESSSDDLSHWTVRGIRNRNTGGEITMHLYRDQSRSTRVEMTGRKGPYEMDWKRIWYGN